jgi:hypothetical protein
LSACRRALLVHRGEHPGLRPAPTQFGGLIDLGVPLWKQAAGCLAYVVVAAARASRVARGSAPDFQVTEPPCLTDALAISTPLMTKSS